MIQTLDNRVTHDYGKLNWIDQNNVVFGFSSLQDCCEQFDWGVWDPEKRVKVYQEPSGLPYHFVFEEGAKEGERPFETIEYPDCLDVVHVILEHDEDKSKRLVFEFWNNHNGYYYHDFSFEKKGQK